VRLTREEIGQVFNPEGDMILAGQVCINTVLWKASWYLHQTNNAIVKAQLGNSRRPSHKTTCYCSCHCRPSRHVPKLFFAIAMLLGYLTLEVRPTFQV
jgi:hypothetical protein